MKQFFRQAADYVVLQGRRSFRCRAACILALIALSNLGCNPSSLPGFRQIAQQEQERITRETKEAIKRSPQLQELDRLCTKELPQPPNFIMVRMYRGYQDEMFLGYGYHSDTDYQQIKTLYREYFIGRGWRQTAEREGGWGYPYIEFMSEDYQVKIYNFGPGSGVNYTLQCERLPRKSVHEHRNDFRLRSA